MPITFLTKPVAVSELPPQKRRKYDIDDLLTPMMDHQDQWYLIAEKVVGNAAAPYSKEYQDFEFSTRMRADYQKIVPPTAKNPQTYPTYDLYVTYRGTEWYRKRQAAIKLRRAGMAERGTKSGVKPKLSTPDPE